MADSACLVRSFSQPSEFSRDFSEGESLRSLGESVSFGRYMTEPLAWEKFSAFTSNRYIEEAEKYSKPGSVAKMKAFFEAHYGNMAVKRQEARVEQARRSDELELNDVPNCSYSETREENFSASVDSNHDANEEDQRPDETESVRPEMCMENSIQLEAQCIDQRQEETESVRPEICMENSIQPEAQCTKDLENRAEETGGQEKISAFDEPNHEENRDAKEEDQRQEETQSAGHETYMENTIQLESQCAEESENCAEPERQPSKELEEVQCVSLTLEMESSKMNDVQEKLNSKVEKPPNLSTGRSPYNSKPSRLPVPSDRIVPLNDSNKWQSITNIPKMDQSKKVKRQDSNNRKPTYIKPSEIPTVSVKGASLQSSKEGRVTPSKKHMAKDTFTKRLAKDALSRLSPRVEVNKKSTRASQKSANENPPAPSAKHMKDKATPLPTLNRARMPKDKSAKPQSETGWSKATPGHSFAGDKRGADFQSTCAESMPSSSSVYKARLYKFTPFNFRTEERAAKRRELLQRRQEEATGKIQQLETPKPEHASAARKLLYNIGFKAKPAADSDTKSPSRHAKKILPAPPLSAKHSRPGPSKKRERPRACNGKNDPSCNRSKSSSLEMATHENASPNIL